MTQSMKAAAVLIALGSESASEIYKYLHDEEVENYPLYFKNR